MKTISLMMAGVAAVVFTGSAFAQDAAPPVLKQKKNQIQSSRQYDHPGSAKYRPLTVSKLSTNPAAPPPPASPDFAGGLGNIVSAPLNAIGGAGVPLVGTAGSIAGGAVSGATNLALSPLGALGGQAPSISPVAAPPLPIEARYAGTGKVFSSYDEGYSQDVPVDASGPIYKINDKAIRTVTPFTLAAFPVEGLAYGITSPLRPRAPLAQ